MTLTASSTLAPAEYSPVATANAAANRSQLEQNPSPSPPFEFQRKSGREETKPAPHSQEGPGAKQMTWNRHHGRRKGASPPRHVVWLVLPPGERPREGKIQQQKPSPPTSGNSSWVPSTRGCRGWCPQKGNQSGGAKSDLPEGSMQRRDRSQEEPRNLVWAILTPCAAQSCWKRTAEK